MHVTRFVTSGARAVIAHQDITERKLAEKTVAEREALLSQVLHLLPVGVWITDANGDIISSNPAGMEIWDGERDIGPQQFDEIRAWRVDSGERLSAEAWAASRAITHGEASYREFIEIEASDGSRKFLLNSAVPLRDDEKIFGAIIVDEDITARRRVEEQLEQLIEQLWTLHEIAVTVGTLSDLPQTLPRVAEKVTGFFKVDATHLLLAERDHGQLQVVGYERGPGILPLTPMDIDFAELPLARHALPETRTVVTSPDVPVETTPAVASFLKEHDFASFMLVPLVATGDTVGFMALSSAQADRTFSAEEMRLAETIAANIAAAVANDRLLQQAREAAALQERQRIAGDLHDSVTQTIYSVSIMAQSVPRLVREGKLVEAERNATQMRLATLGALAQLRALLFELRPSALASARLSALVQQLADVLTDQWRVPVDVVVKGDGQPPVAVKLAFYRIAQETFNNIAKHARATQVLVIIDGTADGAEMRIHDDGRGFDTAADYSEQMGLRIMSERAQRIGARLELVSGPGEGTTMTLAWKAE
jgi:signal transduction histidine kinase